MKEYTKESLSLLLENNILDISFVKISDGSTRKMKCTKDIGVIPFEHIPSLDPDKKVRIDPDDIVRVYDLEAQGWRSFSVDNLVTVELSV